MGEARGEEAEMEELRRLQGIAVEILQTLPAVAYNMNMQLRNITFADC